MSFDKLRSIRPLTKLMLKLLQDCYHREKNKLDPPPIYDPELVNGLKERGLLEIVPGKKGEYRLTALGKEYISHYFGD